MMSPNETSAAIDSDLFSVHSNYIHLDTATLQEIAGVLNYIKVSDVGINKTIENLGNRCIGLVHGRALELLDPALLMTTSSLLS